MTNKESVLIKEQEELLQQLQHELHRLRGSEHLAQNDLVHARKEIVDLRENEVYF